LGERIREARLAAGLTIEAVALRIGVTQATVLRLENGKSTYTRHYIFIKLARVLKVDPTWLCFGDEGRRSEAESRSAESLLDTFERLLVQTAAQDPRASNSEDRVRDALKRIVRGL
jgi:transcriptional regulator with XRE-family HTH domain